MSFHYTQIDTLPKLAWCARVVKGGTVTDVLHGSAVEVFEDYFIEGAWPGDFGLSEVGAHHFVAGSGCFLRDGRPVFVAPTNLIVSLYSAQRENSLYFSNSLVFLLTTLGDKPSPAYPDYFFDLAYQMRRGLNQSHPPLPSESGGGFSLHKWENFEVDRELQIQTLKKPRAPYPENFESYRAMLLETLAALFSNAADSRRKVAYRPLAMLSQGYDCNASAALASQAGCREGMTLYQTGPDGERKDSGKEVADYLGLECHEYDSSIVPPNDDLVEAEFAASAVKPTSAALTQARSRLSHSLLITGRPGDNMWDGPGRPQPYLPDLRAPTNTSIASASDEEFRLRVGYIKVPAANIGGTHRLQLSRLSDSDAMKPWSIGGSYDRPIPRRILEESGVPRHIFGQQKRAGLSINRLTPSSEESFREFYRSIEVPQWFRRPPRLRWKDIPDLVGSVLFRLSLLPWQPEGAPLYRALLPLTENFTRCSARAFPPGGYFQLDWEYLYLFHWGFEQVSERYALQSSECFQDDLS